MMNRRSFLKVALAAIGALFVGKTKPTPAMESAFAKPKEPRFAKFEVQDSAGTWQQIPVESMTTSGISYDVDIEQGGYFCPPEFAEMIRDAIESGEITVYLGSRAEWNYETDDME